MIPYDGFGYGQSTYWSYVTKLKAEANGEYCKCWDENSPKVIITCRDGIDVRIQCFMQSKACRNLFDKTENDVKIAFEKFYDDR